VEQRVIVTTKGSRITLFISRRNLGYGALPVDSVIDNSICGNVSRELWQSHRGKSTPTYTAAQIEQIQQYVPDMVALRDRMSELQTLIKRRD